MASRFDFSGKIYLVKRRQRFPFWEAEIKIKVIEIEGGVFHCGQVYSREGYVSRKPFSLLALSSNVLFPTS